MPTGPRTIDAVFFDLGYTLVDPSPSFPERIALALAEQAIQVKPRAVAAALESVPPEVRDFPHGWTLSYTASFQAWTRFYRHLLEQLGVSPAEDLAAYLYQVFSQPATYAAFADVVPVLKHLQRRGYALGLISNWESWGEHLLEHLSLSPFFPLRVFSGRVGVEKPDLAIFRMALDQAGLEPERVVYVGDSVENDMLPAVALGMRPVLLDRYQRVAQAPAVPRITSLRELLTHDVLR
jgi:putative hydrolase of the HAD superfamily